MTHISVGDIITFRGENGYEERYFVHRYLRARGCVVLRSCGTNTLGIISARSLQLQIASETAFVSRGGLSGEEAAAFQRGDRFTGRLVPEEEMLARRNEARVRLEEKYGTRYASRLRQSERAKVRLRERAERLLYWIDLFDNVTAGTKGGEP